MSTIDTSLIRPIENKLFKLRMNRLFWILVDGGTRLWLLLLGLTALSMFVDWYFRLDVSQRVLLMLVSIGLMLWVAYRRILHPIRVNLTDDVLLRTVEDRYGAESHEAVISAVQLARRPFDPQLNMSQAMVKQTIEHGVNVASGMNFAKVIDNRKFSLNMLFATLGVFLVCGVLTLAAFHGPTRSFLSYWFPRNVLMSPDVTWPERTALYLEGVTLVDGKLVMTRGDDLTLLVSSGTSVKPGVVNIRYKAKSGGGWSSERMDMKAEHFTYRIPTVLEPILLQFNGGDTRRIRVKTDDQTLVTLDEVEVLLKPRPELVGGSLKIVATPPAYTHNSPNGQAYELNTSLPVNEVLYGSSLKISGESSKPLRKVMLDLTLSEAAPIVVEYDGSGQTAFEIDIPTDRLEKGAWTLTLLDTDGIRNDPPLTLNLRLKRDEAPKVLNELNGIGDRILETAILPLTAQLSDDFEIKGFRMLIMSDAKGEQTYDVVDYTPEMAALIEEAKGKPWEFNFARNIDIMKDLTLLLEPDTVLTFYIEAWDSKSITTPFDRKYRGLIPAKEMEKWNIPMPPAKANASLPRTISVRVVTLDEFTQYLTSREKDLGSNFSQLLKTQEELLAETEIVRGAVKTMRNIESSDKGYWAKLGSMEKSQRAITRQLNEIADQYEELIEEVKNNRMPGADAYDDLIPRVILPLREIAKEDGLADNLALKMGATRKIGEDFKTRDKLFAEVMADQERMIERMRWLKERMKTLGEFQEAVNYIRQMAQKVDMNQDQLRKYIEELRKVMLEDEVFEDVFD